CDGCRRPQRNASLSRRPHLPCKPQPHAATHHSAQAAFAMQTSAQRAMRCMPQPRGPQGDECSAPHAAMRWIPQPQGPQWDANLNRRPQCDACLSPKDRNGMQTSAEGRNAMDASAPKGRHRIARHGSAGKGNQKSPSPAGTTQQPKTYSVPSASSGAPCRRNSCGRFCENAERGSTMSHPTSCAFCFRSPCTCDRNPIIEVPFLSLLFNLGINTNGLTLALLRSKINSDGGPSPFCL